MKRFFLLCAALFSFAHGAAYAKEADTTKVKVYKTDEGSAKLLSGAALNDATEANRTVEIETRQNWSKANLFVYLTRGGTVDPVTITFWGKPVADAEYARLQTRSCSSGTCTLSDATDSKSVSGDADWIAEYDVRSYWAVKWVLSGTNPTGDDVVDAYAVAVVGN